MPPPTGPRTPGYRFKDGKLMIFSDAEVQLICGWEKPSAVAKADDYWEPFVPEFRLVAPYRRAAKASAKKVAKAKPSPEEPGQLDFGLLDELPTTKKPGPRKPPSLAEQRKSAFDSFRFSLPKEVAKVLEGFRSHQWHLLLLLAHDKRVLDIATANPVLAYAVADWYADYPRSTLDFGKMPQRNLLKLLKLPDSAALVKLFRKIPPASIDPRLWKPLLQALRRPDGTTAKWLAHVPTINIGVMELILTPQIRAAVTPKLLEEVAADAKEKYRAGVAAMLRDTLAMKHEVGDGQPLTAVTSVARLREVHASVSEEFRKLEALRNSKGILPRPPLPGVKDRIVPLCTKEELLVEGRMQKNCVASYADRVAAGGCYIYRVMHPKRATLSILLQSDGNWGIGLLEASCNRPADQATRAFVTEWIDLYRVGA